MAPFASNPRRLWSTRHDAQKSDHASAEVSNHSKLQRGLAWTPTPTRSWKPTISPAVQTLSSSVRTSIHKPRLTESQMMPGDWYCSKCGDHQFAKNAYCRMCWAPKPTESSGEEEYAAEPVRADIQPASLPASRQRCWKEKVRSPRAPTLDVATPGQSADEILNGVDDADENTQTSAHAVSDLADSGPPPGLELPQSGVQTDSSVVVDSDDNDHPAVVRADTPSGGANQPSWSNDAYFDLQTGAHAVSDVVDPRPPPGLELPQPGVQTDSSIVVDSDDVDHPAVVQADTPSGGANQPSRPCEALFCDRPDVAPPPGLECLQSDVNPQLAALPESLHHAPGCDPIDVNVPPGLDLEGWTSLQECPLTWKQSLKEWPTDRKSGAIPQGFQVLLRNVPDSMADARKIHAMLERGMLAHGLTGICFRPGGKVLVAFSCYEQAARCVGYFAVFRLGCDENPVSALYVRTVKTEKQAVNSSRLSAAASAFVPCSLSTGAQSYKAISDYDDAESGARYFSEVSTASHSRKMSSDDSGSEP